MCFQGGGSLQNPDSCQGFDYPEGAAVAMRKLHPAYKCVAGARVIFASIVSTRFAVSRLSTTWPVAGRTYASKPRVTLPKP